MSKLQTESMTTQDQRNVSCTETKPLTIIIAETVVTTRPPVDDKDVLGGRISAKPASSCHSQCGGIGDEMEEAVVVRVDDGRRGGEVIDDGDCNAVEWICQLPTKIL